jgi:hypothetical protein
MEDVTMETRRAVLSDLGGAMALLASAPAFARTQGVAMITGELRPASVARFAAAIRRHQDDVISLGIGYALQPVRGGLGAVVQGRDFVITAASVQLVLPFLPSMVDHRRRGEINTRYTAAYDRMESTRDRAFYVMTPFNGSTAGMPLRPIVDLGGHMHHEG